MRVVLLALVGCGVDAPDTVVVNRGEACVWAWPPELGVNADHDALAFAVETNSYDKHAFALDAPILVRVSTRATACSTDVEASCTVRKLGGQLIIENRASWNEPPEGTLCPRVPPPIATSYCAIRFLDEGDYVVKFAGSAINFPYLPDPSFDEHCFRPF